MKTSSYLLAATMLVGTVGKGLAVVHYVDVNGTNATPPYTNWTTAATNIQDAVVAALAGDEIVVSNGIYSAVTVDKPLRLWSVNGAQSTTIDGGHTNRCASLAGGASLSGFTLTHGLSGLGGGVSGGTLTNCILSGNQAFDVDDCGDPYGEGGAAFQATLNNCIVYFNTAPEGPNYDPYCCGILNYCCTTPQRDRPHQRAICIAIADTGARRNQPDDQLAKCRQRDLLPGARHKPVSAASIHVARYEYPRSARHDHLYRH